MILYFSALTIFLVFITCACAESDSPFFGTDHLFCFCVMSLRREWLSLFRHQPFFLVWVVKASATSVKWLRKKSPVGSRCRKFRIERGIRCAQQQRGGGGGLPAFRPTLSFWHGQLSLFLWYAPAQRVTLSFSAPTFFLIFLWYAAAQRVTLSFSAPTFFFVFLWYATAQRATAPTGATRWRRCAVSGNPAAQISSGKRHPITTQSRKSAKIFLQWSELGLFHPFTRRQVKCATPPPPWFLGGAHSLAGDGVGES